MPLRRPLVITLTVTALLLTSTTGCETTASTGGSGATASSAPASTPTAGTGAAASADVTAGTGATASTTPAPSTSPVLADGRWAVYLTGIDVKARTTTFDLIEFLTGDAAKKAWKQAFPNSSQDGPDNDYFIVNDNSRLRILPVTATAQVKVLKDNGGSPETYPISFANLPSYLAAVKPDDRRLSYNPFWLTVQNGRITRIDEQFVP